MIKIEKLQKFIEEKGMDFDLFSKELEITPQYLYMIVKGDRNPSYNFMKKLKKIYPDADLNELFFTHQLNNVFK